MKQDQSYACHRNRVSFVLYMLCILLFINDYYSTHWRLFALVSTWIHGQHLMAPCLDKYQGLERPASLSEQMDGF
jgi:hypothetical protein